MKNEQQMRDDQIENQAMQLEKRTQDLVNDVHTRLTILVKQTE